MKRSGARVASGSNIQPRQVMQDLFGRLSRRRRAVTGAWEKGTRGMRVWRRRCLVRCQATTATDAISSRLAGPVSGDTSQCCCRANCLRRPGGTWRQKQGSARGTTTDPSDRRSGLRCLANRQPKLPPTTPSFPSSLSLSSSCLQVQVWAPWSAAVRAHASASLGLPVCGMARFIFVSVEAIRWRATANPSQKAL